MVASKEPSGVGPEPHVACICGQSKIPLITIRAMSLWERAMSFRISPGRKSWPHPSGEGHGSLCPL